MGHLSVALLTTLLIFIIFFPVLLPTCLRGSRERSIGKFILVHAFMLLHWFSVSWFSVFRLARNQDLKSEILNFVRCCNAKQTQRTASSAAVAASVITAANKYTCFVCLRTKSAVLPRAKLQRT